MSQYHLAQINIARMVGVNIDDPIMKEFVENIDRINAAAEESPGFVWRLKDDANNACSFDPYGDDQIIVNISVWESIEALEEFTYRSVHTEVMKRRKEWFQKYAKAYMAMWWTAAGSNPSLEEAVAKLDYLQANGPTASAFSFRERFPAPA